MMTEKCMVSVIMAAYNSERTIVRAIESVISQTFTNWELIIIDDSSKDTTKKIVEKYCFRDSRIQVISNEKNLGVAETRNRGVQIAKSEWIAFLDSDDYWEAEKLEYQFKMLKKYPDMGLCFTGSAFIDERGNRSRHILHVPEKVNFDELLNQNIISCSSVLIKTNLMILYPMLSRKDIHEDFVTWLKVLKRIPYAVGVDAPLLVYQVSSGSKSGNKLKAAKMQWNSYRVSKIPVIKAIICFVRYAVRNIVKYKAISSRNT